MVLLCGGVVGTGGFDFGVETAQMRCFVLTGNLGDPSADAFIQMNAGKPRRGVFSFTFVTGILGVSSEAEVGAKVIEGISVFMVNEDTGRGVHNFPVQPDGSGFAGSGVDEPRRIKFLTISVNGPVKSAEAIVNIGVNNGPEAVAEGHSAERVAVFFLSIPQDGPSEDAVEAGGDLN
jgi:hypothetical protein